MPDRATCPHRHTHLVVYYTRREATHEQVPLGTAVSIAELEEEYTDPDEAYFECLHCGQE